MPLKGPQSCCLGMFYGLGVKGLGFGVPIMGLYRDNGKEHGKYRDYRDYRYGLGFSG